MRKIVLLCNGGLSTGILVRKMKKAAEKIPYGCEILAVPVSSVREAAWDADLILLGPQVLYQQETVKRQVDCQVAGIEPKAYGKMDGEAVFAQAKKLLDGSPDD